MLSTVIITGSSTVIPHHCSWQQDKQTHLQDEQMHLQSAQIHCEVDEYAMISYAMAMLVQ